MRERPCGSAVFRGGLTCLVLAAGLSARAETGSDRPVWEPARTWVFMVGLLEWENPVFSSFPQENRRDEVLLDVLRGRGVPESQITYLQDEDATTERVHREFEAFLGRPKRGDWVFVYFTGHGSNSADHKRTYLATYDTGGEVQGWEARSIPALVDRHCRATYAILAADNCCSGGLAQGVRGIRKPRTSFAVFTSAHVNSGSTAHWTFTENLVYAFGGEGFMDDDGDGAVTLGELRDNAREDMAFAEGQMSQYAFSGSLTEGVAIAKAARPADPEVGKRAEFLSAGEWYAGFTVDRDGEKRKVRFYGYAPADDEWVTPDMIRPRERKTYPVGTRAEVMSKGEWHKARVVGVRDGLHFVKFDGWASEWNEWVPAESMR